ncbi:MAG: EamA family transporter [Deltaproteobacteria bacterium]|nr:EamA family transporter [Deltaproteobacteria bacterium]MBW2019651.1 EamA family transporter [Deltaproteobacteria bacterium]MBW2074161.1 EamA family transporter [Deltaproteobacteria bacterium]RLB83658.1 MAG: EamA family transporter [Deltaproteobacteria bacterium]
MNWFVLSLACAYFMSTSEVFSKLLMRDNDEWTTGCGMVLVSFPFLVPLLIGRDSLPLSWDLIALMGFLLPFEILAYYIYLSAIRIAPLSLSIPYLSFTPVFAILTAAFLLQERISLQGFLGILMVTVGAYVLNIERFVHHPLAPFKAIFKSSGSRRMLIVALIWSLTSTLGKKGVQLSDPVFFGVFYTLSVSIPMLAIAGWRIKRGVTTVNLKGRNSIWLLLGGLVTALATISHFHAIQLAPVSYMIAVKRTSLIFSVLYGGLIFKEEHIRLRLLGTSIMLSGVVILYLA